VSNHGCKTLPNRVRQANRAILYVRSVYDYCLDLQADVLYRHAEAQGWTVVQILEETKANLPQVAGADYLGRSFSGLL